ncbi:response regulator transcription factor [Skermanella mucosa]|uniref:response regulator n=1 Tax=Skermanella mucosa TaxID=1789672 RepID=UPI00192C5816|nr:response regulator transcription factor [Skermanella mucosa]UEM23825.1 response regulator transcription factor [Skermanella mucosa]
MAGTPAGKPERLLLVDDHPVVRTGCRRLLASAGPYEIMEADSGARALELCGAEPPDAVVLDLGLPDIGGLDLLDRLRRMVPDIRVLVFSMHEDAVFAARALEAGARGYVTKNDAPEELVAAVGTVLAGGIYLSRDMAREVAVMSFAPNRSPLQGLTARELRVLAELGQGSAIADIAERLGVSYKTVSNTCTIMKTKLGARSIRDLIRIAVEHRVTP